MLTPSHKRFGKSLAWGGKLSIAAQCLSDLECRKHVAAGIGRVLQSELAVMCSKGFGSILCSTSASLYSNPPSSVAVLYEDKKRFLQAQAEIYNWFSCQHHVQISVPTNVALSKNGLFGALCWTFLKAGTDYGM